MWARIENGIVAELTDLDPSGRYHPSLKWVACGVDTQSGWHFDGEQCVPPPLELLKDLASRQRVRIEQARIAAEATGVIIDGIRYAGDPSNRQALAEALQFAAEAGVTTFQHWKDSDGNFHLDNPVSMVADALRSIATRRSQLIEREGELVAQVDAALAAGDREALVVIEWSEK